MNKHTAFRMMIIATVIILLMSTSAMAVVRSDRVLSQPALNQNRLNTADLISKPLVIPTTIPAFQSPGTEDSQSTWPGHTSRGVMNTSRGDTSQGVMNTSQGVMNTFPAEDTDVSSCFCLWLVDVDSGQWFLHPLFSSFAYDSCINPVTRISYFPLPPSEGVYKEEIGGCPPCPYKDPRLFSSEKVNPSSRGLFQREPRTIPILDDQITIPPTLAPTPISTPSSSTGCGCG